MTHFASGNLGKLQGEGLSLAGEGRVCWLEKIERVSACVLLKKPLLKLSGQETLEMPKPLGDIWCQSRGTCGGQVRFSEAGL